MKKSIMLGVALVGAMSVIGAGFALNGNSVSNFDKITTVKAATAPTNTRRVWIINNDNWWTDNNYWVYAWNAVGNYGSMETTKVHPVLDDYYHGLGYADITLTDATGAINVQVVENTWGDTNQTVALSLPAFGGADVIWMNNGTSRDDAHDRRDRNASLGTTNGFSAAQLAAVLAGYNTCSPENTFGYNAYPQLNLNFFSKCDADVLTSETTLSDYDYEEYISAGKDYGGITKSHTSKIVEKIAGLRSMYEANN